MCGRTAICRNSNNFCNGFVFCVFLSFTVFEFFFFFFSSRRRHTRCSRDWSSDVCSSDLEDALLHDGIFGVAGEIKHFGFRTCLVKLFRELAAAHAGHYNVGDEHVNRTQVRASDTQRRLAIFCFQDLVTLGLQSFSNQLAHRFFIFNEKNRLRTATGSLRGWHGAWFCRILYPGQIDAESRPAPYFALRENITAALLDDAIDGRKTKARTLTFFFRGEERFKYSSLGFAIHAMTCMGDGQHYVWAGLNVVVEAPEVISQMHIAALNGDLTAARHRVF